MCGWINCKGNFEWHFNCFCFWTACFIKWICNLKNWTNNVYSSGCIILETRDLLLSWVLIKTTCGYKCVVCQLIYTLLSQRSPRIHPSRRRQPLAHKWYVHIFYWFSVLVAQAEGWAGQTQQAVRWNSQHVCV